jgi:hypothetical protein
MEMRKTLTILFIVWVLPLFVVCDSWAAPLGTGFTYQGRLIDANNAADGIYDLQFKLYNANIAGTQKESTLNVGEVDVVDGYFTVLLDFGSDVFNGDARWLDIGIRPGELEDPNRYTVLQPRQEVTPTPYAIYAQTAGGVPSGLTGSGTANYIAKFIGSSAIGNSVIYESAGNVGIGTTNPTQKLEVAGNTLISEGTLKIDPTTPTLDPIIELKSDNPYSKRSFMSFWHQGSNLWMIGSDLLNENTTNFSIMDVQAGNYRFYINSTGNVGIGTAIPSEKLTVEGGTIKASTPLSSGKGVYGYASNSGDYTNFGGYFEAAGGSGRGVFSKATGSTGIGVLGMATNSGDYTNYGGYFSVAGSTGRAVYGMATSSSSYTNYGGYFSAAGSTGRAVYGTATSTTINSSYTNYGGYFSSAGGSGQGVRGEASNSGNYQNFGGYFEAAGGFGKGVYGEASNSSNVVNYGGYFKAAGSAGRGVYGRATGSYGTGVYGYGGQYDFYADGPGTDYGSSSSIRWKRNVRPIDEALDKVMSLRGVYFNWDAEHGGQHDVGMIAEEVGEVLPEIVEYEENGIDATGMDYSKLTPLLVEAVKALKAENDALKKRIEALEAKM